MPPKRNRGGKGGKGKNEWETVETEPEPSVDALGDLIAKKAYVSTPWTASGNLDSQPLCPDIKIGKFSVSLNGVELVQDTTLELNMGRRYGLIGANGSGKTTMMRVLGERQVPIPSHIDIFHLTGEVEKSDLSALDAVVAGVVEEVQRLEKLVEELNLKEGEEGVEESLQTIYDRIDALDPATASARASKILLGLGFTNQTIKNPTNSFSGGWRMRIALARALFVSPALLLLDEPTNHLDLEACIWLEEYLKTYKRILVIISHSQDFLNGVCTNIIHLQKKVLKYYGGNYDSYVSTRAELEGHQMKQYNREQAEIAHMKEYIARFGHGSAKLARQAQSKEKTLARMVEGGLTEKVEQDRIFTFHFYPCGQLPVPVLMFNDVAFGYNEQKIIYKKLDFGIDLDSRVALVGPNGAGKSTLLKLMVGDVLPTHGMVRAHPHLRLGRYHQHLQEEIDLELTPLEFMKKEFPELATSPEMYRQQIGRFGLTGKAQTTPMKFLSDGQKSRCIFAWIANKIPHILLLDEPTNHLDIETIDSLANAISAFEGGLVLVSHDFRLISQVCDEIWECKDGTIKKWPGDIMSYKKHLRDTVLAENEL
jgi:ATP-binding cassette subfamily F protein 2